MKSTTDRDSNFELLRIVAMMMIVGFHSVYKGNIIDASFMNKILIDIVWHWGEIGVNVFLLISGYHLAYQEYNRRKIYYIVLQVLFYLVFTTIVACLYWNVPITSYIKANCFPVLSARYWFITVYIYIYILSPYIKMAIENMNKEKQKAVAFTLFFVWSFFPSFIYPMLTNDYSSTETMPFYSRFVWGVSVYIIGAILYSFRYEITLKKSLVWFICIVLIQVGYIVLTELNIIKLFGSSAVYFWPPNSVSSILIAILLVLIFSKVKIKRNCIVNYIASCSLGIYMLHDGYLQLIFWQDIFKMNEKGTSEFFLSYLLVTIVTVFLAGIIIDTMWKGCWKGLYVIKQIGNKKM